MRISFSSHQFNALPKSAQFSSKSLITAGQQPDIVKFFGLVSPLAFWEPVKNLLEKKELPLVVRNVKSTGDDRIVDGDYNRVVITKGDFSKHWTEVPYYKIELFKDKLDEIPYKAWLMDIDTGYLTTFPEETEYGAFGAEPNGINSFLYHAFKKAKLIPQERPWNKDEQKKYGLTGELAQRSDADLKK